MEAVSLRDMSQDVKLALLQELGLKSDGIWIYDRQGSRVTDRYIGEPVPFSNMVLIPGSVIVIDHNPVSLACYFEEFGETF